MTDERIELAAKLLAERIDYPWEYMPPEGKENFRKLAAEVSIAATAPLLERIAELEAKLAQHEAQEPVEYQYQSSDGTWHGFIDERHKKNTIEDGRWPIRALFTRPQPAQKEPE